MLVYAYARNRIIGLLMRFRPFGPEPFWFRKEVLELISIFWNGCQMRKDGLRNFLLFVIAIALVVIAVRPYVDPAPALAQSTTAHAFYIEPGV
jgi:hypothetical protein